MSFRLQPNFSIQKNRRLAEKEIKALLDHWAGRSGGVLQFTPVLEGYEYLVGHDQLKNGYFVIWDGAEAGDLTYEVYMEIMAEVKRASLESRFYVFARSEVYQSAKNASFIKLDRRMLEQLGWVK